MEAFLKKNIMWVIVGALVIAFLQVCNINKKIQKNLGALKMLFGQTLALK